MTVQAVSNRVQPFTFFLSSFSSPFLPFLFGLPLVLLAIFDRSLPTINVSVVLAFSLSLSVILILALHLSPPLSILALLFRMAVAGI